MYFNRHRHSSFSKKAMGLEWLVIVLAIVALQTLATTTATYSQHQLHRSFVPTDYNNTRLDNNQEEQNQERTAEETSEPSGSASETLDRIPVNQHDQHHQIPRPPPPTYYNPGKTRNFDFVYYWFDSNYIKILV
jgi:hypothetical protein